MCKCWTLQRFFSPSFSIMHLRICSTVSWFSSFSSETQQSHRLTLQINSPVKNRTQKYNSWLSKFKCGLFNVEKQLFTLALNCSKANCTPSVIRLTTGNSQDSMFLLAPSCCFDMLKPVFTSDPIPHPHPCDFKEDHKVLCIPVVVIKQLTNAEYSVLLA